MDDYILIPRSTKGGPIWQSDRNLKWWIDILFATSHDGYKICIGGKWIRCRRGQSARPIESWAASWDVSELTVKRFFRLLESYDLLETEYLESTERITVKPLK